MLRHLLLLFLILSSFSNESYAATFLCGDDEPSVVRFDLEECLSNSGVPGSATDYSEFMPEVFNTSDCTELIVEGGHLYRLNPDINMHSCSPGVDNSTAMCVGISDNCEYDPSDDKAIRFDITVNPLGTDPTLVSEIRFFENAPEIFNWIDGPSGPNNYPTKYSIRVLVDGTVVFEMSDVDTENEWNEEVYDFSDIPAFTVTESTTFNVELLPYCPVGIVADVAAWDVDAISFTAGCIPIDGGDIALESGNTSIDICAGDELDDILEVNLSNNEGQNSQWVITDNDLNILDLPENPPFNFEGADEGVCLIWHLSFLDGLTGAEIGLNAAELEGCFDLSNPITVTRTEVNGGEISFSDGSTSMNICAGDGILDTFTIDLENAIGQNMAWVITDTLGNILDLPIMMPFDFEGAGPGVCLIWNLSFADGLEGAEIGLSVSDLEGCFALSNPLSVLRSEATGGDLSFEDGTTSIEICAGDGMPDPLNVELFGNLGDNSAWVITDTEGEILDLPSAPPFDLENAPSGTCLIWHLSFADGLQGAEIGMNASDLEGCFSLSNSLSVTRVGVDGGELSTTDGETQLLICADDGESDAFDVDLTGAEGSNNAWVITDNTGLVLDLPDAPPFDLEGSGSGACLIWNLSYEDGIVGAEIGLSANDLEGCFDLSNPITVTRLTGELCDLILCEAEGGNIEFVGGSQDTVICVDDGIANPLDVTLGDNVGANSQWVITDTDANILALPNAPPFDLEGVEPGTCLIWHLSFEDGLEGAVVGNNAATDLSGCFDLSNALTVERLTGDDCNNLDCDVDGGSIVLSENGETEIEICVGDTIPDPLNIDLIGEIGTFSQWVITNANGLILDLPASPPFDLNDAPPGLCLIWHLSYEEGLEGAAIDSNANNLQGCYDLSNPIFVTRLSGPACDNLNCDAVGGTLLTEDGQDAIEICSDDGESDVFDVDLVGNVGDSSAWIITDISGVILDLPVGPPFDLEGAPEGVCLVWHLSYFDELTGLEVGLNALDIEGCLALSTPITVTRYSGNNCLMIGCEAVGGTISFQDTSINQFIVCGGDVIDDLADVLVTGESGSFSQWVITDSSGNILELPIAPPFNFETAPPGICLIWHLSYEEGLEGAEVGLNAEDLTGCFNLSNSLTVIRNTVDGGEIIFDNDTTSIEICVGDNESDSLTVNIMGAQGDTSQWVITDTFGVILDLPLEPPFDFESAPAGVCLIWHLSFNDSVENLEVGLNANEIEGCFNLSNPLTVIRLEGEDCDDGLVEPDPESKIAFTVGPNPANSTIQIRFQAIPSSESQAYIFDSKGQLIESRNSTFGRSIGVDVQDFSNGMYFVRVQSDSQSEIKKFIKID